MEDLNWSCWQKKVNRWQVCKFWKGDGCKWCEKSDLNVWPLGQHVSSLPCLFVRTGKTLTFARTVDIPRSAYNFRFFASSVLHHTNDCCQMDHMGCLNYTVRCPVGVGEHSVNFVSVNVLFERALKRWFSQPVWSVPGTSLSICWRGRSLLQSPQATRWWPNPVRWPLWPRGCCAGWCSKLVRKAV